MTEKAEELTIAENYLKEMLEADETKNFELYTKRTNKNILLTSRAKYLQKT